MNYHRRIFWALLSALGLLITTADVASADAARSGEDDHRNTRHADDANKAATDSWSFWGADLQNSRHAAGEHEIDVRNARDLHVKWEFAAQGSIRATPTTEGNSVYVPDGGGFLHRIHAKTGRVIWSIRLADALGVSDTTIVSATSPAIVGNKVIFGTDRTCSGPRAEQVCLHFATVAAVDKKTGALIWQTQVDDHPYARVKQSPVALGHRVFVGLTSGEEVPASFPDYPCCTFRGSMLSLDANSGKILWKEYTVPPGYTGATIWGGAPSVDVKRNSVYFTTGNNYTIPDSALECVQNALTEPQTDPEAPLPADPDDVEACYSPGNWFDSIVAVDLKTGHIKWGFRGLIYDYFTGACFAPLGAFCPDPAGPDWDFGGGASLFSVATRDGHRQNGDKRRGQRDLVGAGQKSGVYWAVDPDTGELVWSQQVGPGGDNGGMQHGSAVDGRRVYVAENNRALPFGRPPVPYTLPDGQVIDYGSYAALDAKTGDVLWQVPNPAAAENTGAVTVANGVVYACERSSSGRMFAFDAATGELLWDFESGASCSSGAAVVRGTVYWGAGSQTLYAFTVNGDHR